MYARNRKDPDFQPESFKDETISSMPGIRLTFQSIGPVLQSFQWLLQRLHKRSPVPVKNTLIFGTYILNSLSVVEHNLI